MSGLLNTTLPQWPERRLGATPKVGSPEALDRALEEIAAIESAEKTVDAAAEAKINLIKHEAQQRKRIPVGQKDVPFRERRHKLEAAVEAYCNEHRAELLEGEAKSVKRTHGTCAWKIVPEKVVYADDENKGKAVVAVVEKMVGLKKAIASFLERLTLSGSGKNRVRAGDVIKLNPSVDMKAIKEARKAGRLNAKELKALQLEVVEEHEEFRVDPSEYTVTSG